MLIHAIVEVASLIRVSMSHDVCSYLEAKIAICIIVRNLHSKQNLNLIFIAVLFFLNIFGKFIFFCINKSFKEMITFWFTCEQDGRTWLDRDSVLSVRDYITVYYEQNWSTNYKAISSTLNLRFSFCF